MESANVVTQSPELGSANEAEMTTSDVQSDLTSPTATQSLPCQEKPAAPKSYGTCKGVQLTGRNKDCYVAFDSKCTGQTVKDKRCQVCNKLMTTVGKLNTGVTNLFDRRHMPFHHYPKAHSDLIKTGKEERDHDKLVQAIEGSKVQCGIVIDVKSMMRPELGRQENCRLCFTK